MEGNLHLYSAFFRAWLGRPAHPRLQVGRAGDTSPGGWGPRAGTPLRPQAPSTPTFQPHLRPSVCSLAALPPPQTSLSPQGHQLLASGHLPTPCLKPQAWTAVQSRGHRRTREDMEEALFTPPERGLGRQRPTGNLISDFQPPGPSLVSGRVPGQGSCVEKWVE